MGKAGMPERPPQDEEDDDWKAAEKALAEARRLQGSQRFEALKRAGQLRYDAHKKRHENEPALKFNRPRRDDRGAENEAAIDSRDGEGARPPRQE
jgi:hypothetical protein